MRKKIIALALAISVSVTPMIKTYSYADNLDTTNITKQIKDKKQIDKKEYLQQLQKEYKDLKIDYSKLDKKTREEYEKIDKKFEEFLKKEMKDDEFQKFTQELLKILNEKDTKVHQDMTQLVLQVEKLKKYDDEQSKKLQEKLQKLYENRNHLTKEQSEKLRSIKADDKLDETTKKLKSEEEKYEKELKDTLKSSEEYLKENKEKEDKEEDKEKEEKDQENKEQEDKDQEEEALDHIKEVIEQKIQEKEEYISSVERSNYTKESIENYAKEIANAKKLLLKESTKQELEDEIIKLDELELVKVEKGQNRDNLIKKIKEKEKILATIKKSEYTRDSLEKYAKAIAEAKNALVNATTEKDLEDAIMKLDGAKLEKAVRPSSTSPKIVRTNGTRSSVSTKKLPKSGIENEQILLTIACVAIIAGISFAFFKKRERN